MGLVDYSDSDGDDEAEPARKKRKPATVKDQLPPLPAAFRDLYSSTVRTSTHDDPSLHEGRKRVTPHIAGNWPTHVYLDWTPQPHDYSSLQDLITHAQKTSNCKDDIHSLLENDLGVRQPLHVSLSRPLALKTEHKDTFFDRLKTTISLAGVSAFSVRPLDLVWHPNEDQTRWFLVLRLQRPSCDELRILLERSNDLARQYNQPLLYGHRTFSSSHVPEAWEHDNFHISIAWSIQPRQKSASAGPVEVVISDQLLQKLKASDLTFREVKVRIGQDVHSIPLRQARKR